MVFCLSKPGLSGFLLLAALVDVVETVRFDLAADAVRVGWYEGLEDAVRAGGGFDVMGEVIEVLPFFSSSILLVAVSSERFGSWIGNVPGCSLRYRGRKGMVVCFCTHTLCKMTGVRIDSK